MAKVRWATHVKGEGKFHVRNIFGKANVSSRREAVAQATGLGLF